MTDAHKCPDVIGTIFAPGINEDGEPFVNFGLIFKDNSEKMVSQYSVEDIRNMGQSAFEAAEAAETDATLFTFFKEELAMPIVEVAKLIRGIRIHRAETRKQGK